MLQELRKREGFSLQVSDVLVARALPEVARARLKSQDQSRPPCVPSSASGFSCSLAGAIDLHARQSAAIMREFAGGWYSKQNWETQGEITLDDAQRFVAVALRKLRAELKRESA